MPEIRGNTQGLKQSRVEALEATYELTAGPEQVTSPELARRLAEVSSATGRQVGALLNRRGEVEHLVVGDAFKLDLPELGRARSSAVRLRGLRLVHTHLKDGPLSPDDLTQAAAAGPGLR